MFPNLFILINTSLAGINPQAFKLFCNNWSESCFTILSTL